MGVKSSIYVLIAFSALFLGACSHQPSHQASGYIEGRYTYIATSVSGALRELLVDKGSRVKQGQKLYSLELQPESDAYMAAQENLKQAVNARDATAANLEYARLTYERYKVLVPKKAIQQSQLDNARSTYDAALAQLAQADATIASATATLAQVKWSLDQKVGTAPVDAIVFDTYYRLGEFTEANKPVLSLLGPADIKVIFYVSEADLGAIHLNDPVTVQCNGADKAYTGKISFISPSAEYTPPVIFSTETNEKLVFRIEADFAPQDAYQLHPGQPATVTYQPHG